jgi:hypothetical protein
MLYSVFQEVTILLDNATSFPSPSSPSIDYGILQGAATLLAGLLIFLTLERKHFRIFYLLQHSGATPPRLKPDTAGIILFITLVSPCVTIAVSLFPETIFVAKVSFIVSLVALVVFILHWLDYNSDSVGEPQELSQ